MPDHQNDEPRLGVPGLSRAPGADAAPATNANPRAAEVEGGARPGDTGVGVPLAEAAEVRVLSESELAELQDAEERLAMDEARRTLAQLDRQYRGFQLPTFLRGPLVAGIAAITGLFGLMLISQITVTIGQVNQLPLWWQIPIYLGLAACAALVLYSLIRLLGLLVRLRANRRIVLGALRELQERRNIHAIRLARHHLEEAQSRVKKYLREYPLEDSHEPQLQTAGLTMEDIVGLRRERTRLLDPERDPGPEPWLDDFRASFQSVLDRAAGRKVAAASRHVGLLTAAAPNSLFDIGIALYSGFGMVGDLCVLYHLRASRFETTVILGRVIVNAYIAGNLQALTDSGGQLVAEQLKGTVGNLLAKTVGFVAARAAEGTANGFMIHRLGQATRKLLQPVS